MRKVRKQRALHDLDTSFHLGEKELAALFVFLLALPEKEVLRTPVGIFIRGPDNTISLCANMRSVSDIMDRLFPSRVDEC